jgi:hypothetical protein
MEENALANPDPENWGLNNREFPLYWYLHYQQKPLELKFLKCYSNPSSPGIEKQERPTAKYKGGSFQCTNHKEAEAEGKKSIWVDFEVGKHSINWAGCGPLGARAYLSDVGALGTLVRALVGGGMCSGDRDGLTVLLSTLAYNNSSTGAFSLRYFSPFDWLCWLTLRNVLPFKLWNKNIKVKKRFST